MRESSARSITWFGAVQTKQSDWERPEEQAWRAVASPAHEGRHYYVNDKSQESTWDKPAELGWEKHLYSAVASFSAAEL